jgi:alkanesulfonate monooxygenase SsuD/methylene tetrahydromethanopterin reductase-like flavin-dependent oxidoreductase (luciferase family)
VGAPFPFEVRYQEGDTYRKRLRFRSLLLRWRRSFRPEPMDTAHQTGFVPTMVVAESGPTPCPVAPASGGSPEIAFAAELADLWYDRSGDAERFRAGSRRRTPMIPIASGVPAWIATGHTVCVAA